MYKKSLLLLLITSSLSWSTTYYVDYVNGINSNTGKSQISAWKNCPGDAAATLLPMQTTLVANDTVIFKGGIVYKGETCVKWSGSGDANRITYDGNTGGTWGSGKAMIDGENVRSYGFSATTGTTNYVTIKNFEIMNMKYTGVPWQGGAAIKIDDASYVTISNCYLHDVGYWKNDGSIIPAGNGVHMLRPKNCLISGCEITRTGLAGIEVDGSVNCTFSRNNIHDYITWGIDIGGDFNLCTGNVVCDNTVHDLYQYDAGYWGIPNDPNIPHTDYIFLRQGGGQRPINNTIERNLFYNNQVFHEFGGTAIVFLSYADNTIIRNNVFINPHGYYATRFSWTSSGTKFYNNTIYAPNAVTGSSGVAGVFLETNGNTDIRNNIIVTYQSSIAYTSVTDESGLISDYNLFYNVTSSQDFVRITPARYATYAQWQTFGYDAHSLKAAAISDIKFANVAGYPTSCQTMDLSIVSSSPAVNTGTTLTGFTNDIKSTPRPQGTAWDIGACEAMSAGAAPTAPAFTLQPQNQTVTAGQTASFTIAASGTAPLAFQWQRSNDLGTTWANISAATAASITTGALSTSDNNAQFRCIATNAAGTAASATAKLTVNAVNTGTTTVSKLSGTAFGASPAMSAGTEFDKAMDNNISTHYEFALNNGGYAGIDLGATGVSKIAKIRFYPQPGFEFRMSGGKFQGSNTSSTSGYVDLYTIPTTPLAGWNEVQITDQNAYRYVRFVSAVNTYCTIAEMEFYSSSAAMPVVTSQPISQTVVAGTQATFGIVASGTGPLGYLWQRSNDKGATWITISGATSASYTTSTCAVTDNAAQFRCVATNSAGTATSNAATLTVNAPVVSKLSGTAFGASPAWAAGTEFDKATDNNISTRYEFALNNGGYTGLDLGATGVAKITKIRFYPQPGFEFRMSGGKFQGSNTSSTSGYVDLYTIPTTPLAGWNEVQITDQNAYRYVRFVSAVNTYCTIAEMEFYGSAPTTLPMVTAVTVAALERVLPKEFGLTAVAADAKYAYVKVQFSAPFALNEIRFEVFNLLGKSLQTVSMHEIHAGNTMVSFDNRNHQFSAGNYLCRVHADGLDKAIIMPVR